MAPDKSKRFDIREITIPEGHANDGRFSTDLWETPSQGYPSYFI
jgi:hypothetical protein